MSDKSYQNLMEGLCEFTLESEKTKEKLNVTHLLRDLYNKIYEIKNTLLKQSLEAGQETQTDQTS